MAMNTSMVTWIIIFDATMGIRVNCLTVAKGLILVAASMPVTFTEMKCAMATAA